MENNKEDTKSKSHHTQDDKPLTWIEERVSKIENKLDELSNINEKRLLKAKLLISERRVTFLLAILALLGILYPLYKTESNTNKVDGAIQAMENRFKELAGEYSRKPDIICDISGVNLLNNSLIVGYSGDKTSQTFMIKNSGDASAGQTYIYLYVNYEDDNPFLLFDSGYDYSEKCRIYTNDNPRYCTKFYVCPIEEFHAGRELNFRFEHILKIDSPLEVPAMLKIYYNGPKPIEIPFTMRFIPKKNIEKK
jgi:hypothetical protein